MQDLKKWCCLLMFAFPSIAFAAGVALDAVMTIAVAMSTVVTVSHSLLVLLLRWRKLFKHNYLVIVSLIISVLNLMLLMFVFLAYAEDSSIGLSRAEELVMGAVLMMNFILIIKTFTIPRKQYNRFLALQNETTN